MGTLSLNRLNAGNTQTVSKLDLNAGPHEFDYVSNAKQLVVENYDSGDLTLTLTGAGVGVVDVPTVGDMDLSGGVPITVLAGATQVINLDQYRSWLGERGNTVTVSSSAVTGPDVASVYLVEGG